MFAGIFSAGCRYWVPIAVDTIRHGIYTILPGRGVLGGWGFSAHHAKLAVLLVVSYGTWLRRSLFLGGVLEIPWL